MVSRSSEISDKHHYSPEGKIKVAHGHDEGSWQDPVSELAMFQGLQHVSAHHLVHVCRDEKVVFAELGGWSKHSLDSLQSCFLLINLIHPNILIFGCLINNFIWLNFHKSSSLLTSYNLFTWYGHMPYGNVCLLFEQKLNMTMKTALKVCRWLWSLVQNQIFLCLSLTATSLACSSERYYEKTE